MNPNQTVHIRWQGKPVGPFSLEQLRELAASNAITPATEVAAETAGPWARIETLPLNTTLFSAAANRPNFHRANTNSSPPINLHDIIAAANRSAPTSSQPIAPSKPISAEHDVSALLQFNHEIEKKRGLFTLAPKVARKSRRGRDYRRLLFGVGALIFMILSFEAVLAVSLQTMAARMPDQFWPILWQVLFHSPILAWGVAMFAFYAIALGWLMFGLMDDY